ncbi:hypothetical protein FGIG_06559, partial [Fasciola gigantica]
QVHVVDFTTSWRDGLAFCALLHRHWPELIDFENMLTLDPKPWERIETVFKQATDHLGIPRLIEPVDLFENYWSDERCILTVVVTWYQYLTSSLSAKVHTSRLSHVLRQCLDIDQLALQYKTNLHRWFQWADVIKRWLVSTEQDLIPQSLKCPDPESWIRDQLRSISEWSQTEKLDRMLERSELEFLLHTIQIRQLAAGHNRFYPPEGFRTIDVDERWRELTSVERTLYLAHLTELTKQANLKYAGRRFDRKLSIFTMWLAENEQLLQVTERADAASFRSDMSDVQEFFCHITTNSDPKKLHQINLTSKLHRITTARRKHAAWLADAEAYVDIRSQRLRSVLNELLNHSEQTADIVDRTAKWNALSTRWMELQSRFALRTRGLKATEDWLYCLADMYDLLNGLCFRLAELNTCDSEQTVQIEITLNRISDELNQLDRWASLVEITCLNQAANENDVITGNETKSYPVLSDIHHISCDYVQQVRQIHSSMSQNLKNLNRWNNQKRRAYESLSELTEEMEWVQRKLGCISQTHLRMSVRNSHASLHSPHPTNMRLQKKIVDQEQQTDQ